MALLTMGLHHRVRDRGIGSAIERVFARCLGTGKRQGAPRHCTVLSAVCSVSNRFSVSALCSLVTSRRGFHIDHTALCGAVVLLVGTHLIVGRRFNGSSRCRGSCGHSARRRRVYARYKGIARFRGRRLRRTVRGAGLDHFGLARCSLCVCKLYDGYSQTGGQGGGGGGRGGRG